MMYRSKVLRLTIFSLLTGALCSHGQVIGPCADREAGKIACLNATVVDRASQTLGNRIPPNVDFGNALIVTPVASALPLPSPASGFTYTFDRSAGVYTRSSDNFGSILAERPESIGRHQVAVGFTFQRFVFRQIDGVDIHNLKSTVENPNFQLDQTYNLNLQLNQYTAFATVGINDRTDLSIALPISTIHYSVDYSGDLEVGTQPFGVGRQPRFRQTAKGSHTATGPGDLNLQVKRTLSGGSDEHWLWVYQSACRLVINTKLLELVPWG